MALAVALAALVAPRCIRTAALSLGQVQHLSLRAEQAGYSSIPVRRLLHVPPHLPATAAGRWFWGHAATSQGRYDEAVAALAPFESLAPQYPLLLEDLLIVYSQTGRAGQAVTLYERNAGRVRTLPRVTHAVALAYLANEPMDAPTEGVLRRVLSLRPGDLYANYHLRKTALAAGDEVAAAAYAQAIARFPLDAVDPDDERWLAYAAEVIPALLDEGLWGRTVAVNVAALLAWRHPAAPAVDELLCELAGRRITEVEWPFYLGEACQRRGELDSAVAAYEEALRRDPFYGPILLRLGMVAEAQGEPEQALGWYQRYYQSAPDDPIGLERLASLSGMLGRSEALEWRARLDAAMDDRAWVADELGVSVADVALGANLVSNPDFAAWQGDMLLDWQGGAYLGDAGGGGLYIVGRDELLPDASTLRMLTVRGGSLPDGTVTYAEQGGTTLHLEADQYLLTLLYAADYAEGGGTFLVGQYTVPNGVVVANLDIPDSNRLWSRMRVIVDGSAATSQIRPLLRNRGVGDLCVDAIGVRPVTRLRRTGP